jgi:hypothetical protein
VRTTGSGGDSHRSWDNLWVGLNAFLSILILLVFIAQLADTPPAAACKFNSMAEPDFQPTSQLHSSHMKSGSEKYIVALDKAGMLARGIVGTPASNIRVTWSAGAKCEKLDLDHWKPGRLQRRGEYHALATLSRDRQRLRITA